MTDFAVHPIGTQDRLDLYREVFEAAKSLRELSSMIMVKRDSRRKAENDLDKAINDYEELFGG